MKEFWIHIYPNYMRCLAATKSVADEYDKIVWRHGQGKPIYRIHVRLK